MRNNNVHNTQGEDSRSITKLMFGIVGFWFLAAFVGGMLGIFNQPDTPYSDSNILYSVSLCNPKK